MKIKTTELTDAALDWAVCEATGLLAAYPRVRKDFALQWPSTGNQHLHPSTDWSQGGPIIEREKIDLNHYRLADKTAMWEASGSIGAKGAGYRYAVGPTPLIAAMRCYVASKLGEEVEVPEELAP
jgi:hypothetical protein